MLRSACVIPFLNPLGKGKPESERATRSAPRSDSGFPSCYAWLRDEDPRREATGFGVSFLSP
jgi:hypothetical protein